MPTPYSQRDPRWKELLLGHSGHTVELFGCIALCVLYDANRFYRRDDDPSYWISWLNSHDGFDSSGRFVWTVLSKYRPGSLRYLGSGLWAKLRKKYTIQQVAFGPIGHWVALRPGNEAYDPWQGAVKPIINGMIEIEGRHYRLLNNFRYLG